ncbi:phosphotransferase [Chloroflexia bacterium SDU3-3]|nr:phosphotransferase [Chloroflexia bacterium SDU3-3]
MAQPLARNTRRLPMVDRDQALSFLQQSLQTQAEKLYGIALEDLHLRPAHQGGQNIVYSYTKDSREYILRISFRSDRPPEQIQAELDFVLFLSDHGARVSTPVRSRQGRYSEVLWLGERPLSLVVFEKAPGDRLADRGYQYRDGAPIEEYFANWGQTLGKMHRLARRYAPDPSSARRALLVDTLADQTIPRYVPASQRRVRERCAQLIERLRQLPRDEGAFGLIHGDFSDGNFCIDYADGTITAFDFDDAAYCWFMYDLADAWRAGTGWIAHEADAEKRRAFMERYFATLLQGYAKEHTLSGEWLGRLPLFVELVAIEAVMNEFRAIAEQGEPYDDEGLAFALRCIEEGIPFLGFFDPIYSHEHPFQLR